MGKKLIIATGALLLGRAALAETPPAEGDYFSELPVVLSASRLVQTVEEAPAAVTILDRDTIRASGARKIVELFRLVPGFQVGYQNGHEPTVTYHGLADAYARRLQVMIDGVSVYSPIYGGVEWNLLPIGIEDIERIEVVRGPNGASFGANAFTGMVNIITREPLAGPRSTTASMNAGTDGIADWSLQHSDGKGDWRYRVSAGQRSDRGFDNFADNSRSEYLRAQGHYRLNVGNELMGTFSYSGGYGQEQSNLTPQVRPRRIEDTDVQLRWTRAVDSDNEFWLQFHHGQRHATEDLAFTLITDALPPLLPSLQIPMRLNFKFETQRDELEFQQTTSGAGGWRWLWGGHWRQDSVRSQTFFGRPDWLNNSLARLFGSAEWQPMPKLLLHAGATYEHPSLGDNSVSPRLSATFNAADGHSLRAGISQARRNPVPFEESVNWGYPVPEPLHNAIAAIPARLIPLIPSPWNTRLFLPVYSQQFLSQGGLSGEKILSREIAYLGRLPSLRMNGDVRLFSDRVSNLIYVDDRVPFPTVANDTTRVYRQGDSAALRGIEGSLQWSPWPGSNLLVAVARTKISSSSGDPNSYYANTAPVHSASTLFRQNLPWQMSASVGYYHVGAMQWLSGGDPVPAYDRVDLRLARNLRWGPHRMEVAWVTQNLSGKSYQDFYSYLINKRVSWLNIRYEY
jgi:iron complex outermembrane recepter protein